MPENEPPICSLSESTPVFEAPVDLAAAVEAMPFAQLFAERDATSSAGVGAAPSTTTTVTCCTERPAAVRPVMR
jgi:hypothetical protein